MWEDFFLINVNEDTKLPQNLIWADSFIGDEPLQ